MARNQKNFKWFKYLKDNADEFNLRGESGGAFSTVDGNAPFDTANPALTGISPRNHPRRVTAQDATTLRTVTGTIYTPTAFAAIDLGDTIAVQVAGLATTVNYTVIDKIGEHWKAARASYNLPDS